MFLYSTNPSSSICFSFIEGFTSRKKSKAVWNIGALLPGHLTSVCSWRCFSCLPLRLALVGKLSSSSSCLLFTSLVWCLSAPEFLQDPYLETLHPPPFFARLTISFMISLMGSTVNPVKSYTTPGHSFFQQDFIVWGLMAFTAFL